ncbi:hypothetical protein MSI_01490 [Treponema sp. JC4]|uniref:hypothetical protein n=1 Tax=Treponema sp. JC4 TaxID=1124982 RepID=UPI00025B09CB|nr:hypothetical protein [Treponema sp. JC4]EID86193.1 hypothetical protein MSI_01490 [Treponema sp. JC4]
MRRYLNRFFTELAALFLSCLLISCSALFNSSDTGSVSFSLSSDQLRAIVAQPQSARTLMQENEPITEDEGELRHLVLQLAVYSYDFQTFKSGQLRYSYYEIEAGVQKSVTLDEIPVGQYALVALLYQDESMMGDYMSDGIEPYYMRRPLYCGAEESIYVNSGSQSVAVTMIDFRGAFIKGFDPDYKEIPYYDFQRYLESAVGTGEDSDFGQMCICASEDKPFYALLTENYGIVSIGLVEGSPKRNFPIRELATVNSDLSNFAFLKDTNVITVDVTASPSETEGYYDMTYEINFHGKTLVFNGTEESGGDEPGGGGDDPSGGGDEGEATLNIDIYTDSQSGIDKITIPANARCELSFKEIAGITKTSGYWAGGEYTMDSVIALDSGTYRIPLSVAAITSAVTASCSSDKEQGELVLEKIIEASQSSGVVHATCVMVIYDASGTAIYKSADQNGFDFSLTGTSLWPTVIYLPD